MFQGEWMTCAICRKSKRSDPEVESNWTYIQYGDKAGYVCPKCLQGYAAKHGFQKAYVRAITRILRGG